MSDTPRTDEAKWETAPAATVVSIFFAQTLERELVALREQLKNCSAVVDRQSLSRNITSALLRVKLEAARQEVEVQKAKADKHYELGTEYFDLMVKAEREIAALRDVLSRLIKVHDAMGGKCGTVRIAAEEALLGKAQSEYICTCGIRVTPHKCPTDNDF